MTPSRRTALAISAVLVGAAVPLVVAARPHGAPFARDHIATMPAPPRQSSASSPAVVTRLIGEWRGRGVVTGRASEITMTWERAVGGAFLHLRFRNAMAASATRPAEVFEGHGYYRVTTTPPGGTGTWIDSRGLIMPVRVAISDDSFTSDWGGEGTEAGRTLYRLTGADALEVVDFVRGADGAYKEFGRSQLQR